MTTVRKSPSGAFEEVGGGIVGGTDSPGMPIDLPISGSFATIFELTGTGTTGQRVVVDSVCWLTNGDENSHSVDGEVQASGAVTFVLSLPAITLQAGENAPYPVKLVLVLESDGDFTIAIGFRADGAGPDAIDPSYASFYLLDAEE